MNPTTGSSPFPPGRKPMFTAKTSLGLLGAMLLALVAMLGLLSSLTGGDPAPDTAVQGIKPKLENVDDGALAGMLPEEARRGLERDLGAWFKAADRAPIRDAEAIDEPEWVAHLLTSAVRVPLEGLPPRIFGAIENVPKVLDEPGPHRGRLVQVWGRVESVSRLELEADGSSRERPREALLLGLAADNGARWTATCLTREAPEVGAWVKVHGVFTKLWPVEGGRALHVFSSRRLVASFAPVAHTRPQVEWLTLIEDEDIERSKEFEERPFYGMLNYLRTMGADGYRELRDTDQLQVADLTADRAVRNELVPKPASYRLQAVRIRGHLLQQRFVDDGDIPENPGNIESVSRGYLVTDPMLPVLLYSPFTTESFDVGDTGVVEVEGFFFKRQWTAANGKTYWLPVLILADIETVPRPETGVSEGAVVWGIVVGALLMLVGLGVAIYRNQRAVQEFRERQAQRKTRRGSKAST